MVAYTDGLNFVTLLAQQTPPITSRTRLSGSSTCRISNKSEKRAEYPTFQRSPSSTSHRNEFANYNGNYEGDSSMFDRPRKVYPPHQHHYNYGSTNIINHHNCNHNQNINDHMDLIETDSDSEFRTDWLKYHRATAAATVPITGNQLWHRLWIYYIERLLTPQRITQIVAFTEELQANYYYQRLSEMLRFLGALLIWLMGLALCGLVHLCNWSYGFWKSRTVIRNTARRLLWCMTLAKCGDTSLFALILLTTPLVFIIAFFGFIISVYCLFKEWLGRSSYFIRNRVF